MSRPSSLRTQARSGAIAGVVLAMAMTFFPSSAVPALAAPGLVVSDLNQPGMSPTVLAQSLVGSGVTISNITFTGNNRGAGKFSGGTTIIGFDSGVVLASGKVQTYTGATPSTSPADAPCSRGVEGPNNCHEATGIVPAGPNGGANSTSFGTAGDADLTALSGFTTFDATVLEFDFVPMGATVQFQYVFGSEEYSDFSNTQFNDVFGFFVNGANCAKVPVTGEPVSINTINNGNDVGGDATPHNAALFRDNVRPAGPTIDTQLDGLTVVLTCTATVKPNVTNHLKLAIADASDRILDSAVFIQAGSLTSGTQVTTSLKGSDGSTGPIITVPSGTKVIDSAKLTGLNTPTAGGSVTYTVYSDSNCTVVFAAAGTKTVTNGMVPDSDPVTFVNAATYYWQAAYSGDTFNNPSKSVCGSEQVIVKVGPPATLLLTPPAATNAVGDQHCVTATVRDIGGNPTPGIVVRFTVGGAAATFSTPSSGQSTTDANGQASFCFTAALPGANTIHAFADTNNNAMQDVGEPFGDATKTWILPVGTALCEIKITVGGHITAINGDPASFGGIARSDAAGNASGNEEYQDHGPAQPMNFKATSILAITCTADFKTANVFGNATIDGSGSFPFRIRMTDNGEPGTSDVYGIIISNGYVSGDKILEGGNIQIHKLP